MVEMEAKLGDGPDEDNYRTWLMVGGSYPGALSAWFRLKHPELVSA